MDRPFKVGDMVELIDVTFRGEPVQRKVDAVRNGCIELDARLPWDAKMIASVVDVDAVRLVPPPRRAYAPGQVWEGEDGLKRTIVACGPWGVAYLYDNGSFKKPGARTVEDFGQAAVALVRTEDAE